MKTTCSRAFGTVVLLCGSTLWLALASCSADAGGGEGVEVSHDTAVSADTSRIPASEVDPHAAGQPVVDTTSTDQVGQRYIVTIAQPGALSASQIETLAVNAVEDQNGVRWFTSTAVR